VFEACKALNLSESWLAIIGVIGLIACAPPFARLATVQALHRDRMMAVAFLALFVVINVWRRLN
ncbi:MAG TPA: hypothetical protein VM328_11230, partial [Fimbriimonadaceae bacterium]|nr:hypothetical protein [Fimbriimonadaceae bacterium]